MVGALGDLERNRFGQRGCVRADRLTHGIDVSANVRMAAAHSLIFAGQLLDLARATWLLQVGQLVGAYGWTKVTLPPWVGLEYLLLAMVVAATRALGQTVPRLGARGVAAGIGGGSGSRLRGAVCHRWRALRRRSGPFVLCLRRRTGEVFRADVPHGSGGPPAEPDQRAFGSPTRVS